MPSIQVTGQLFDPTTGVEGSADIRIASVINYGQTTKKSISHKSTDASGNYDFQLVYGKHLIFVKYEDERIYIPIGYAVVGDSTPDPIDIIQLINLSDENPPSELVTELQQLREDTLNDIVDTSAQVLENAGYQGEWVSGTSTALKGETWQVSGRYYVALKDTSVDPINDDDNWREDVTTDYVTTSQNDIVGGSIFKGSNGETVEVGDQIDAGTTHVISNVSGKNTLYELVNTVTSSGSVTSIEPNGSSITIDFTKYEMGEYAKISKPPRVDIRKFGVVFDGVTDSYEGLRKAALSGERIYIPYHEYPVLTSKAFLEPSDIVDRFDWEMANGAEIKHIGDFTDPSLDWRNSSMVRPGAGCAVFRFQVGKLTGNWDGITDPYTIPTFGIGIWLSDYPHIPEVYGGEYSYFTDYGCYSDQDRSFWNSVITCHHNGFQGFAIANSGEYTVIDTVIAYENGLMGFDAEYTKGRPRPMKGIKVRNLICYNNGEHDIAVTTGTATRAELESDGHSPDDFTFECETIICNSSNTRAVGASNIVLDFPNYKIGSLSLKGSLTYNIYHRNAYDRFGGGVCDIGSAECEGADNNAYFTGSNNNQDKLINLDKLTAKSEGSYNLFIDSTAFTDEIRVNNFIPSGAAQETNVAQAFFNKVVRINGVPTTTGTTPLTQYSLLHEIEANGDINVRIPKGSVIDEIMVNIESVPASNKVLFIYAGGTQLVRIDNGLGLRLLRPDGNSLIGTDQDVANMGFIYNPGFGGSVRVRHVDDTGDPSFRMTGKVLIKYSA